MIQDSYPVYQQLHQRWMLHLHRLPIKGINLSQGNSSSTFINNTAEIVTNMHKIYRFLINSKQVNLGMEFPQESLSLNSRLNCPLSVRYKIFLVLSTDPPVVLYWDIQCIELVQRADQYKSSVVLHRPFTAQLVWCTKGKAVQELLYCTVLIQPSQPGVQRAEQYKSCCTVPTLYSPTSLADKTKAGKIRVVFQPTMEQEVSLPVLTYIKFYPY